MSADEMLLFGGSGSRKLAAKMCDYLEIAPAAGEVLQFSDGNLFVRVNQNVRGRHCYVVQSTVFPTNDNFMELLFWIDALKRASAASVTVLMPYFSYAKGDKKDEPRVSIRAKVCADAIQAAARIASSPWTCMHRKSKASSLSRWTISTRYLCSAMRCVRCLIRTSLSYHPTRAS